MSDRAIKKKLNNVSSEMREIEQELQVLDEQILHFADVEDQARLKAMVAETPITSKEHSQAKRTLDVMQKSRDKLVEKLAQLNRMSDALLDSLG